jgi:hypothetical protein
VMRDLYFQPHAHAVGIHPAGRARHRDPGLNTGYCDFFSLVSDRAGLNRHSCGKPHQSDPNSHDAWRGLRQAGLCSASHFRGAAAAALRRIPQRIGANRS